MSKEKPKNYYHHQGEDAMFIRKSVADKLAEALEFYRDATIDEEQGDGGSLASQALKEYRGEE